MKVQIECTYCGHIWQETIYNQLSLQGKTCTHGNCRHKQLIVRNLTDKIDYYQGCPPFEPKVDKSWLNKMSGAY